jgi:hypothetical protein
VARAQSEVPVIGFLSSLSSDYASYIAAAFRQGVTETGFAEGHNVKYEYRYANGEYSLLATMTDELVRRRVAVIAAGAPPGGTCRKGGHLDHSDCLRSRLRSNRSQARRPAPRRCLAVLLNTTWPSAAIGDTAVV